LRILSSRPVVSSRLLPPSVSFCHWGLTLVATVVSPLGRTVALLAVMHALVHSSFLFSTKVRSFLMASFSCWCPSQAWPALLYCHGGASGGTVEGIEP
jgi:hypothetical protein